MFGMMQEKPQPSIRHIQATGRSALKLGTTTIAWAAHPRTRAQSGESTAPGKLGAIIATAIHNAPNTSIQEPGIFVMTGKIWKYQNKEAMDGTDRIGRNCKGCWNGNGYVVCI